MGEFSSQFGQQRPLGGALITSIVKGGVYIFYTRKLDIFDQALWIIRRIGEIGEQFDEYRFIPHRIVIR